MKHSIHQFLLPLLLALLTAFPAHADSYDDLLTAIKGNNSAEVESILDLGIDINSVDQDGNSLLMLAILEGHVDLAKKLLARRPNIETANRYGDTALKIASLKGFLPLVQTIVQEGASVNTPGWTPLIYAAFNGNLDVATYLVKHGADINAQSPSQISPLMAAARNNHPHIVRYLLDLGVDTTLTNANNETAAQMAQKAGHPETAKMIAEAPTNEPIRIRIDQTEKKKP